MSKGANISNVIEGKAFYKAREIASLKDLIKQIKELYGDSAAFQFRDTPGSDTITKSYNQFSYDIDCFGSVLNDLGLNNPHIAIIGENRYEWVVSYFSTVNGAGLAVPLDRAMPANELEPVLLRGRVDILIYSNSFHSIVKDIAARNSRLKACICMNPDVDTDLSASNFYSFSELLTLGNELLKSGCSKYTDIKIDPDAFRVLLFTSGTSASSKAVMLSHSNICADVKGLAGVVRFNPGESVVSILPMHHTFENTTGLIFPLYLGLTIAIGDGLKYISRNLVEYQPSCLIGVPLLFEKFREKAVDEIKRKGLTKAVKAMMSIANVIGVTGLNIRRLLFKKILASFGGKLQVIVAGGAPMDPEAIKWYENIGVRVYQGYGLTETSPVVSGGNDVIRKTGTCGQPLPGIKIGLADADSSGSGELVIQGKNVMLGYWENEEATNEVLRNGWFYTGDLGSIDKKGLISVTGRVKTMIVLNNGKKVFPEELENYLNRLEFVKESFVWGETSSDGDVKICTKIVLDKDALSNMQTSPDDENSIKKLLDAAIHEINKLVPVYKKIRYYVFSFEELIKTTTLKVKRYVEIEKMSKTLSLLSIDMKRAAGTNIDRL